MKKLIIFIALIVVVVAAGLYIFIPRKSVFFETVTLGCTINSTNRFVTDSTTWKTWWTDSLSSKGFVFKPGKRGFNSIDVQIQDQNTTVESRITLLPVKKDSVFLEWKGVYDAGTNPFSRFKAFRKPGDIREGMRAVLARLQSFLENNANIYGNAIERTTVKDTLLIASQVFTADTPSVNEIYALVNRLKEHIKSEGAQETGFPMLHTRPSEESNLLETMVAIPIDKPVKETSSFFKRVMVRGNILVTETRGGPHAIHNAYKQLENYLSDYHMESPAKPFQSLITNRQSEPDTSKWVTKLYYPVF
jgi:hypothetical protein